MTRLAPLLCCLALLCGCAPLKLLLDARPNPFADQPEQAERAALLTRYGDLADRLQGTAAFYDREVRKSHTKARVMGVLVGTGATGAGAALGVLGQPGIAPEARPGIAAAGISGAVLAGLMAILPYAHQYALKEAGYRRQADQAWTDYRRIDGRCGPAALDSTTSTAELGACISDLEAALAASRAFPEDSPCRPPPGRDLGRALDVAREGR